MKKLIMSALGVVILFAFALPVFAANNVSLAEGYMKAGKYPQAIAMLEKETRTVPTNAQAHFVLGSCYALTGRIDNARDSFKSAIQLNPGAYANRVASVFRQSGDYALAKGQGQQAKKFYLEATTYDPAIRQTIALSLKHKGEQALNSGIPDQETTYWQLSADLNPGLRPGFFSHYKTLGNKASDEDCGHIYRKGVYFKDSFEPEIGQRVLAIAKKYAKQPGREKETDLYRQLVRDYLDNATVENELPETKIYKKGGEWFFELEAGEQTDHWIAFPEGGRTTYEVASKPDSDYIIVYQDGKIKKKKDPGSEHFYPVFKIRAIKKSDIRLRTE